MSKFLTSLSAISLSPPLSPIWQDATVDSKFLIAEFFATSFSQLLNGTADCDPGGLSEQSLVQIVLSAKI